MKFLAYITKGLKEVVKEEIREKTNASFIDESPKYIVFRSDASPEELTDLKTVDDLHILLGLESFAELPNERKVAESFPQIREKVEHIQSFRNLEERFSLTVSRYRNDLNLQKVEERVSETVEEDTGFSFDRTRHDNLDFRIHIDEKKVLYSVRICEKPLYFREYYEKGRKGSLKTSIAAGLCFLVDVEESDKVVDNFSGAGTLLCEAVLQGGEVYGGDIDREAIETARKNLSKVSPESVNRVKKLDARSTDQPDSFFDVAVSNFPWGEQVDIDAVNLYSKALNEYRRILKEDARLVVLGDHPELAEKHLRKNFPDHSIESFKLGFLGQTPNVTVADT